MATDNELLQNAKKQIELKLQWGDSAEWKNQDFIALSKKIQSQTGAPISHVTLKRLWGKVSYDGMPQVYTLNTLVQFIGYENWREFVVKTEIPPAEGRPERKFHPATRKIKVSRRIVWALLAVCFLAVVFIAARRKRLDPNDFSFDCHSTTSTNIPNSVVFNYDATKAPGDSVIIQQSWNEKLRATVPRNQHQHTLIYYYPGFFVPKLIINGQIVKEQELLIKSNGWIGAVMTNPIPTYFQKGDFLHKGNMGISAEQLSGRPGWSGSKSAAVSFCNVQDFGKIYSDDFVFKTSVGNNFREGAFACQMTNIYLLCELTAINIPLCAKGCESDLNFFFSGYKVSGKQKDLSAFGVDFDKDIAITVEAKNGKARIYLNDRLVYEVTKDIKRSKIIGIDYVFQGAGSVNYVKLSNAAVHYEDNF